MKKIIVVFTLFLFFTSCSNNELYEKTDYFVEQLNSTYESYGFLGVSKYEKYTSDRKYKIAPIGRLINVRIEDYNATREDYASLKNKLLRHYQGDVRVNNVYICNGGTIMIDCRK